MDDLYLYADGRPLGVIRGLPESWAKLGFDTEKIRAKFVADPPDDEEEFHAVEDLLCAIYAAKDGETISDEGEAEHFIPRSIAERAAQVTKEQWEGWARNARRGSGCSWSSRTGCGVGTMPRMKRNGRSRFSRSSR